MFGGTNGSLTPGARIWIRGRTCGLKGDMGAWSGPGQIRFEERLIGHALGPNAHLSLRAKEQRRNQENNAGGVHRVYRAGRRRAGTTRSPIAQW